MRNGVILYAITMKLRDTQVMQQNYEKNLQKVAWVFIECLTNKVDYFRNHTCPSFLFFQMMMLHYYAQSDIHGQTTIMLIFYS